MRKIFGLLTFTLSLCLGLVSVNLAQSAKTAAAPAKSGAAAPAKTAPAAKPAKAAKPLDRNEVLSLYMSGEFETLVALLENVRRERRLRDKEDSVFIYKFLGVIYGASDDTRKKAESFLYQMLKLDPQEDLTALGVGDSVEAIFERVRTRFSKAHEDSLAALGIHPPRAEAQLTASVIVSEPVTAAPAGATQPAIQENKKRGIPMWVWLTGGGVAAAAAVTGVILATQEPDTHVHTISGNIQ